MGHNQKVNQIKKVLLGLNLPVLPLNTVRSAFYTPDIVTRVDTKFIPIDFINSKARVALDVGGLTLLYGKDIVEKCVAIIDDKLWDENLHDFRKAKLNLPSKLTIIPMREVRDFLLRYLSKPANPAQPSLPKLPKPNL